VNVIDKETNARDWTPKFKLNTEKKIHNNVSGSTSSYINHSIDRKKQILAERVLKNHGPLKSSYHIRSSERFDYQHDICKDYKETGYCGYGEACKFLHDRSDYKSGWQIKQQREYHISDHTSPQIHPLTDNRNSYSLCMICQKVWNTTPAQKRVKTICGHYFHEDCALIHHSITRTCFICYKRTEGLFNAAPKINHIIRQENSHTMMD